MTAAGRRTHRWSNQAWSNSSLRSQRWYTEFAAGARFCEADGLELVFEQCDPARPPASVLIEAVLTEYDAVMGRRLRGGPSATPQDFSPPSGSYLVGFVSGEPACGGGIKDLGNGIAELKRLYVVPKFRAKGLARRLLERLENVAGELGYHAIRLDSRKSGMHFYLSAGYHQIPDYNGNPHAEFWGEKRV
jgi:GNAT superfamily N-acetyltransferase